MKYGFVYQWTNTINNKKYIGSHFGNISDSYIGSGIYFNNSYNKYKKYFIREILYIGSNYRHVEDYLLKQNNAANNKEFYNLKNDAIGGWSHTHGVKSIEIKRAKAISNAKKGKKYKHLEYDKSGINNPMYSKKHSEESKNKIAAKKVGSISPRRKKVIELISGKVFNSVTECAKYYNINQSTMTVLIRNKIINRGICKNKIFTYA